MSTLYCNKTQKLFTRLLLLAINSIKMFISLNVLHNSTKKKNFQQLLGFGDDAPLESLSCLIELFSSNCFKTKMNSSTYPSIVSCSTKDQRKTSYISKLNIEQQTWF